MTTERTRAATFAVLAIASVLWAFQAAAQAQQQQQGKSLALGYVRREGDPLYEPPPAYGGIVVQEHRPLDAAVDVGLREQKVLLRSRGLTLERADAVVAQDGDAVAAVRALVAARHPVAVVLDLPEADVQALGKAMAGDPVILFNVRNPEDVLRNEACSPVLFHIAPSDAMLADGFGQFLRKKNWTRILVLEGPSQDDARTSAAFQHSARKFGLKVADVRKFVPSNDPRQRDLANVVALTTGVTYDVVFVADSDGSFARSVPYQLRDPRPVIGATGLVPDSWYFAWERQGAPQLTQRFAKATGRQISPEDFNAWAAVKIMADALARTGSDDPAALAKYLRSPDLTIDLYKGSPSSFRDWDNQLRQPILLHTADAVVDRPPLEGFLHEVNTLDTLGQDRRESGCHMPPAP